LFRLYILCDGQSTTILPSVTIVAICLSIFGMGSEVDGVQKTVTP